MMTIAKTAAKARKEARDQRVDVHRRVQKEVRAAKGVTTTTTVLVPKGARDRRAQKAAKVAKE